MLSCPPKMLKESFPNDREYTFNALIEELFLVERHIRDNSWRLCDCTPSKHLPGIAGLASEGYGFAEDTDERGFMECLMNQARLYKAMIEDGRIKNEKQFNQIRAWARYARHLLSVKDWCGETNIEEQISYDQLTPIMADARVEEVAAEINALTGNLERLEERQVDEILTILSTRHGIPKPRVTFINRCNPLTDAYQIGYDRIGRDEKGVERRTPIPDRDEIVLCRGGASNYSLAHEFCHVLDRRTKGSTNERSATLCALREVGNTSGEAPAVETLNRLHGKDESGGIMGFTTEVKGYLPLIGGVIVGELIDESGQIEAFLTPFAGTWTPLVKGLIGIAIVGLAGWKLKGAVRDVLIGIGLPIAASGLIKQFMPVNPLIPLGYRGAVMQAAPAGLTPYAVPTGLRAGHPTLMVTKMAPRPGILAPSRLETSMSGKWNLGSN